LGWSREIAIKNFAIISKSAIKTTRDDNPHAPIDARVRLVRHA
jgi:hypothetical protein